MTSLWTLITVLSFVFSAPGQDLSLEVNYCNFELPKHMKQANASFNLSYSFEVDREGRPIKILKLVDNYVGKETVASCLEGWRLRGIQSGKPLVVIFRWQHGEGWVEITIRGVGFSQKIKLTGERCPYLRSQSDK